MDVFITLKYFICDTFIKERQKHQVNQPVPTNQVAVIWLHTLLLYVCWPKNT